MSSGQTWPLRNGSPVTGGHLGTLRNLQGTLSCDVSKFFKLKTVTVLSDTNVLWPNLATPERVTGYRWPLGDTSEFAKNHVMWRIKILQIKNCDRFKWYQWPLAKPSHFETDHRLRWPLGDTSEFARKHVIWRIKILEIKNYDQLKLYHRPLAQSDHFVICK